MTGRTHDLAAFTALNLVIATQPLPHISQGTTIIAFSANLIGGLTPDIDQPTAALWNRIPAGSVFAHLIDPILGGHRFISHSIVGIFLFGFLAKLLLQISSNTIVVNQDVVWWSFMIGFISHLVMDTLTKEGVPWLFPIPIKIGIPPFSFLRIKTGGVAEKAMLFPLLIVLNAYLYYRFYNVFLSFFKSYVH